MLERAQRFSIQAESPSSVWGGGHAQQSGPLLELPLIAPLKPPQLEGPPQPAVPLSTPTPPPVPHRVVKWAPASAEAAPTPPSYRPPTAAEIDLI